MKNARQVIRCPPGRPGPGGLKPLVKSWLAGLYGRAHRAFHRVRGLGLARSLARQAAGLPAEGLAELHAALRLAHRMDYERHDIYLLVTSGPEVTRLGAARKEPWTVGWIEGHVRPGDVLYDIGANVGAYSLVAAKCTGGRARVYAFEPACTSFASLCQNVVLNGCQQSVIPLPVALAAETGMVTFKYTDLRPGAALHALAERPAGGAGDGRPPAPFDQAMLAFRLDELVSRFGLPRPNHVKLDVDGSELSVLRGAAGVLAHPGLRSVMVELNEGEVDTRELGRCLAAGGLRLAAVSRHPGTAGPAYGLFVRDAAAVAAAG